MEPPRLFPEPPAATPTAKEPQPTRPEAARVVRPVRNQVEWVARDLDPRWPPTTRLIPSGRLALIFVSQPAEDRAADDPPVP